MKDRLNIKSIFINEIEFPVQCLQNKEEGIKFYLTTDIQKYFTINLFQKKTYRLSKLIVKNTKGKVLTLFDCFYTSRIVNDNIYIHIKFNEIVYAKVENRNFNVNALQVELKFYNNIKLENLEFEIDNININFFNINERDYIIKLSSSEEISNSEIYEYFSNFFELLFFIVGYFPIRNKVIYFISSEKVIVENNIVDKYITSERYRYEDAYFIGNINSLYFKNIYMNFREFAENNILQLSMFYISIMKSNSYTELNIVQILQALDGFFPSLNEFSSVVLDFSDNYRNEIVNIIKSTNFPESDEINEVDLKNKLNGILSRFNEISFRKKLKILFNVNSGVIFKSEIDKKEGHLPYNLLIDKCYGSRNRISHSSTQSCYLEELENTVYMYKLILLIRILIINQVGLKNFIKDDFFKKHISNLDKYIESHLFVPSEKTDINN